MVYTAIRYDVAENVATLTLARPEKLNAIGGGMIREIAAVLEAADNDDDVRAIIVTGDGRAFCAGADLSRGADSFVKPGTEGAIDPASEFARDSGGLLALQLYAMHKPVIAAINGAAAGLGATMILPMDIRIASATARFGFVFARRGMVMETAASFFLPRIVGISTALAWGMSGRMVDASEALRAGLVSAVVPPEDLLPEALRIARDIAENAAPVSVALIRQMLWRGLDFTHPIEAHRIESRAIVERAKSPDAKEGVASFMEKRTPDFPGRLSNDMPDSYPWWSDPAYA
jgi:enoyl-CoA hydratase/carnithine racemase